MTSQPDKPTALSRPQFMLLLALSLLLLLPRLSPAYLANTAYLFNEDANVFMQQARDLGVGAVWQPYGGYQNLYMRLVMLVAGQLPFVVQPKVMLTAWFAAYLVMMAVVLRKANLLGAGWQTLCGLVLLISFRPDSGEDFFNLTYSQWPLGMAMLLVAVCRPTPSSRITFAELTLLVVSGLTGVFSVFAAPVMVLRAWLVKDVRTCWKTYAIVGCCAAVQIAFILHSNRLHEPFLQYWTTMVGTAPQVTGEPLDTAHQLMFAAQFFVSAWLFFPKLPGLFLAAVGYWIAAAYPLTRRSGRHGWDRHTIIELVLLAALASSFIGAAILSIKDAPFANDFSLGGRYTWVPFILFFMIGAVSTVQYQRWQLATFVCGVIICGYGWLANLDKLQLHLQSDLQFTSFVNFARYREVIVPIRPQVPGYPGVGIRIGPDAPRTLQSVHAFSWPANAMNGETVNLTSVEQIDCGAATDVGVVIQMTREAAGYAILQWWDSHNPADYHYMIRFYPAGHSEAVFAFKNPPGGASMHVVPNNAKLTASTIEQIQAYCLP